MTKQHLNYAPPKETAVLHLLAKGMLYKEIASSIGVQITTIQKHCKSIYKKLQVRNRTEAVNKFNTAKAA
jgi:two-component system, NarL family, response regulator LiaR